jgi:hypothetical protein
MLLPAMLWGGALPRLVAMTSVTKLAYTYDYKTWTETADLNLGYDVDIRGVAFNPVDNVVMILNYVTNVPFLSHVTRTTSINNYDKKLTYSLKGAPSVGSYTPNTSTRLNYDSGKWMWGFTNTRIALSTNNGTSWTGYNSWGSSATRNPQITRYFNSADRYVTCYPNVQQVGVSPVGSFNSTAWAIVSTGFTNNTRYVEEGSSGNFLALGGSTTVGQIATSTNLTSWTVRTWITGTPLPNWAVWNGTTWVVVANGGKIATSTDGITWTEQTSPTANNLTWVDWNSVDNQFVAIGNAMTVLTSPNGVTWTQQTVTTTNFLSSINPRQIARIK